MIIFKIKIIPNYMNFQVIEYKYNALADIIMNYAREIYRKQRNNAEQDCLLPMKASIEILKSQFGINNKNPDDNLRFI